METKLISNILVILELLTEACPIPQSSLVKHPGEIQAGQIDPFSTQKVQPSILGSLSFVAQDFLVVMKL